MVDLLVSDDRQRGTKALVLAIAALLLPWSPGGAADAEEPTLCPAVEGADVGELVECPDKEPEPAPEQPTFDDYDGSDDQAGEPQPPETPSQQPADDDKPAAGGSDDDAPPTLPPAQWAPAEEFGAQGQEPQEVVAPEPVQDPAAAEAEAAVEAPNLGQNLAPSLQTAVQPLTDLDSQYRGTVSVPAPLVAGDDVLVSPEAAPAGDAAAVEGSPKALVYSAALTLEQVEPNLPATLVALAVLGGAALVGALNQRRDLLPQVSRGFGPMGVPVRPDTLPEWAGRSVRPVDHDAARGRSVRP